MKNYNVDKRKIYLKEDKKAGMLIEKVLKNYRNGPWKGDALSTLWLKYYMGNYY